MLQITSIKNGFMLDHIKAGMGVKIFRYLHLDELGHQVALIINADSKKIGKKDIIKIDGGLDLVDLDVLGYIDCNITVNIIKDGEIIEKMPLSLPKKLTNIIKCGNPRCITSSETNLDQIFYLADASHHTYRCKYCDEKAK